MILCVEMGGQVTSRKNVPSVPGFPRFPGFTSVPWVAPRFPKKNRHPSGLRPQRERGSPPPKKSAPFFPSAPVGAVLGLS